MRENAGYTLFELLVVLAIMGLVLATVPMVVATARPGPASRAAAEELAAALRLARGEAIGRYAPTTLLLDVEGASYRGVDGTVHELGEGMHIELVTARSELTGETSGQIRFFPDGSSTGGEIAIADGGRSYRITVDWLTGVVEVEG